MLETPASPDPRAFERVPRAERAPEEARRPSVSYWRDAWRRLRADRVAMFGLACVVLITIVGFAGPSLTTFNPARQNLLNTNALPNAVNWFGTDQFGRDIFTRVIYGVRISLIVAYVATIFSVFIGIVYGSISGVIGGRTDQVMMRIVDILIGVPNLLYLILLMVVFGPGLISIIVAFATTGWLGMARMVRAEMLSLKQREFVLAAQAFGFGRWRITFKHLIPNTLGTIIVLTTLGIPGAIFTEAFLSYIGLGVSAPNASLGVLASDATATYMTHPYQLFFPAMAIVVMILVFNFLGDGLRDALDPKMRR